MQIKITESLCKIKYSYHNAHRNNACFLLFLTLDTADKIRPVGASAPGVGVPVVPPVL